MTRMPRPLETSTQRRIQPSRRRLEPVVASSVAAALHVFVFVVAYAIEPEPTNTEVAWQWLGELAALGYLAALGTAFATLRDARTSLVASIVAGAIGLGLIIACPATGHHELAGWWFGQLGLFTVATVAPVALGRRLRD